jgi:hypothetical protein
VYVFCFSLIVSLRIATTGEYPTIKESNIMHRINAFRGWKEQRRAQHVTEQYATIMAQCGHGLFDLCNLCVSLNLFESL